MSSFTSTGREPEKSMKHADFAPTVGSQQQITYQNFYDCLSTASSFSDEMSQEPLPSGQEIYIGHYWDYDGDWRLYHQSWVRTDYLGGSTSSLIVRDDYHNIVSMKYLDPHQLDTIVEDDEDVPDLVKSIDYDPELDDSPPQPVSDFQETPERKHETEPLEMKWITKGAKHCFSELFESHLNGTEDQIGLMDNVPELVRPAFESVTTLLAGRLRTKNPTLQADIDVHVDALKAEGLTFIEAFRWSVTNWKRVIDSPIFNHVETLLSLAILAGWAPETWGELEYKSVKVYKVTSLKKFDNVISIVDGFISALNFFVESVYASWQQQSLMPFLYEKSVSHQLDERYEYIRATVPSITSGDFMKNGGDWGKFLAFISETVKLYKAAILVITPNSYQRVLYSTRISQLQIWEIDVLTSRKVGEVTTQPFGLIFYGLPGCGKTGMTNFCLKLFAAASGLTYDPAMTASITPDDNFESLIFNITRFIVMNDVANRPLQYDPSLGIAKTLAICDNFPYVAHKAELDLKGKVIPDLLAVLGSTNNRSMHMGLLSCSPDSLRRRLVLVDIVVKRKYVNETGGLDDDKFADDPCRIEFNGNTLDDFQTFTVNFAGRDCFTPIEYEHPVTKKKILLKDISLSEFLFFIEHIYKKHCIRQKEHVAKLNAVKFEACPECKHVTCLCKSDEEEFFQDDVVPDPAKPGDDDEEPEHIISEGIPVTKYRVKVVPKHFHLNENEEGPAVMTHDDEEFQEQAGFGILTRTAFDLGMSQVWQDRLSPFENFYRTYFCDAARATIVSELITQLNYADETQWWYWLPNDLWDTDFVRWLTPMLVDARTALWMRWANAVSRVTIAYIMSMCIITIINLFLFDSAENYFTRFFCFDMTRFIKCAVINTLANFLICIFRCSAYRMLSRRRDAIGQIAANRREAYSTTVKTLLGIIATLGTGALVYTTISEVWPSVGTMFTNQVKKTTGVNLAPKHDDDEVPCFDNSDVSPETTSDESTIKTKKPPPARKVMLSGDAAPPPEIEVNIDPQALALKPDPQILTRGRFDEFSLINKDLNHNELDWLNMQSRCTRDFEEQGFLGETEAELIAREKKRSMWETDLVNRLVTYRNPTMTTAQFEKAALKNQSVIFVQENDEWVRLSGMAWMCTNCCLIPLHLVPTEPVTWMIQDNESESSRSKVTVSPANFTRMIGVDMAFGYIVYRSKANLIEFFDNMPSSLLATYITKDKDFNVKKVSVSGELVVNAHNVPVIDWEWREEKTYRGACGGWYIRGGPNPGIVGVHFGGLTKDLSIGRSFLPSRDNCKTFLELCAKNLTVVLPPNPSPDNCRDNFKPLFTPLPEATEGKIYQQVVERRNWSPPQVLTVPEEEAPEIEVTTSDDVIENQGGVILGNKSQQGFYKSKVEPSVIAEAVKDRMYDEVEFGGPRFGRSMWPKTADFVFEGSPGPPVEDLNWAVHDYLSAFDRIPPYLKKYLRPLTRKEVLNGIPGVRFIDQMNFQTSMGLRYKGPKKEWVTETTDIDGNIIRDFVPEVWEDVDDCLARIDRGEEVGWVFNSVPKDEPTPTTKEKVRLFQVCEVSLVVLCRMYFTPICRLIQMIAGTSECAVGIDPLSSDWEAVVAKVEKFVHAFDGDYSKYDLRMPASVNTATGRVLLELAAKGEYSPTDLNRMSVILFDIILPAVNFCGEVYRLDGSSPSGIPITVIINGIGNSLLNRCGYFDIYPKAVCGTFRKYVSHINYGDDFINSVSAFAPLFNFLTLQEYLKRYGIIITPGLKEAEGEKYVKNKADLVFLQRVTTRVPGFPNRFGKLNEKSIFKSLLSTIRSTYLTPEEAVAQNVDGALREWFFHGRATYEHRRAQLYSILLEKRIAHLSRHIDTSYDDFSSLLTEKIR